MAEVDLLDWLTTPSTDQGIEFLHDDGDWPFFSYRHLAASTVGRAQAMQAGGLGSGDVAVLLHRTGPGFVSSFFGILAAGATPAPPAPPQVFADSDRRRTHYATASATGSTIRRQGATPANSVHLERPTATHPTLARPTRERGRERRPCPSRATSTRR